MNKNLKKINFFYKRNLFWVDLKAFTSAFVLILGDERKEFNKIKETGVRKKGNV